VKRQEQREVTWSLKFCDGVLCAWYDASETGQDRYESSRSGPRRRETGVNVSFERLGSPELAVTSMAMLLKRIRPHHCDFVSDIKRDIVEFCGIATRLERLKGHVVGPNTVATFFELDYSDLDIQAESPSVIDNTLSYSLLMREYGEQISSTLERVVIDLTTGARSSTARTLTLRPASERVCLDAIFYVGEVLLYSSWPATTAMTTSVPSVSFRRNAQHHRITSTTELLDVMATTGHRIDELAPWLLTQFCSLIVALCRVRGSTFSAQPRKLVPYLQKLLGLDDASSLVPRVDANTLSFFVLNSEHTKLLQFEVDLRTGIVQTNERELR
jgi:hypothetical protein